MDFLFISRNDGCEAAAKAGATITICEKVGAKPSAAAHHALFAGIGVEVGVGDDFSRMILLHHSGLVVEGCGGGFDLLAPFVAGHVVADVNTARSPGEFGEAAYF